MTRAPCSFGILLAILLPAVASADPPGSDLRGESPRGREEAIRRYNQAIVHLQEGRTRAAIVEFESAYQASPLPSFLYNIAEAYRRLGESEGGAADLEQALAHYRRYLEASPQAADRVEVERLMTTLERRLAPATPPVVTPTVVEQPRPPPVSAPVVVVEPPAPTVPPTVAPSRGARAYLPQIAVGSLALATALVGTILVASVKPEYDELLRTCGFPCPYDMYGGLVTRAYTGYALWGIAGAAAIVDVALWIVALRRRPPSPERARLRMGWGGLALDLRYRF